MRRVCLLAFAWLLSGTFGCSWLLGITDDPVEQTDAGDAEASAARDARALDGPIE